MSETKGGALGNLGNGVPKEFSGKIENQLTACENGTPNVCYRHGHAPSP